MRSVITSVFAVVIFVIIVGAAPTSRPAPDVGRIAELEAQVAQLHQELDQLRQVLADAGVITLTRSDEPPRDYSDILTQRERQLTNTTRPSMFDERRPVTRPTTPGRTTPTGR